MGEKTAEQAAVERYPDDPRNPLSARAAERAAFVAGWNARLVLTREQIAKALFLHRSRTTGPSLEQVWAELSASLREPFLVEADALLAQGDVASSGPSLSTSEGHDKPVAVVDREALARMLGSEQDDRATDAPRFEGLLLHPRQARAIADAIIASGIVRDAAEVRAEVIDWIASEYPQSSTYSTERAREHFGIDRGGNR